VSVTAKDLGTGREQSVTVRGTPPSVIVEDGTAGYELEFLEVSEHGTDAG
jgi:hypothetical protein